MFCSFPLFPLLLFSSLVIVDTRRVFTHVQRTVSEEQNCSHEFSDLRFKIVCTPQDGDPFGFSLSIIDEKVVVRSSHTERFVFSHLLSYNDNPDAGDRFLIILPMSPAPDIKDKILLKQSIFEDIHADFPDSSEEFILRIAEACNNEDYLFAAVDLFNDRARINLDLFRLYFNVLESMKPSPETIFQPIPGYPLYTLGMTDKHQVALSKTSLEILQRKRPFACYSLINYVDETLEVKLKQLDILFVIDPVNPVQRLKSSSTIQLPAKESRYFVLMLAKKPHDHIDKVKIERLLSSDPTLDVKSFMVRLVDPDFLDVFRIVCFKSTIFQMVPSLGGIVELSSSK